MLSTGRKLAKEFRYLMHDEARCDAHGDADLNAPGHTAMHSAHRKRCYCSPGGMHCIANFGHSIQGICAPEIASQRKSSGMQPRVKAHAQERPTTVRGMTLVNFVCCTTVSLKLAAGLVWCGLAWSRLVSSGLVWLALLFSSRLLPGLVCCGLVWSAARLLKIIIIHILSHICHYQ